MDLVSRNTPRNTPVGALKAKVVHLLSLHTGDDTWSLCDKKVRGHVFVRDDAAADIICPDCIDYRDYREAREAGFEHRVSYSSSSHSASNIAGSRARSLSLRVYCYDCAPEGQKKLDLWSRNGGTPADAEFEVRQHFLAKWREHKAAEEATR
jgi:hypothetical protein